MNTPRIRRIQIAIITIALVALLLPAIGQSVQVRAAEKVLRYSMTGEPDTIDPQNASYTNQVDTVYALWAGLLRLNPKDNTPVPYIAKEVPSVDNGGISKDGKTITFHLRNDWKWSDGKGVVKAQDFVYSWQRLVDPANAFGYGFFLNGVVQNATEIQGGTKKPADLGVKAADDFTFVVTLTGPKTYITVMAADWCLYAVRKDNVERKGLPAVSGAWTDPANGEVVGSGPFILKKWDHNNEMDLERNPNYSGTPAKLDKLVFDLNQDPAVEFAKYQAGELDVSPIVTAQYEEIKADPVLGKELFEYPLVCSYYMAYNNTKPPFNKKGVREAFTEAIDRDTYIKVIRKGGGEKQLSFIPPAMTQWYDKAAGTQYDFNAEKAKKALADAGYPDGKGMPTVPYNYVAGANGQRAAEWFQAQFQDVLGVQLELNPMDAAAYEAATSSAKSKLPGMELAGWCADYPHPADWFTIVFGTGQPTNLGGYSNPEFDKRAAAADSETDPAKQTQEYLDLQKYMIDDFPAAFLFNFLIRQVIKPNVIGIRENASGMDGGYPGSYAWESLDIK